MMTTKNVKNRTIKHMRAYFLPLLSIGLSVPATSCKTLRSPFM